MKVSVFYYPDATCRVEGEALRVEARDDPRGKLTITVLDGKAEVAEVKGTIAHFVGAVGWRVED